METKRFNKHETDKIAAVIKEGGFVALPTDTVYGLAGVSRDAAVYQALKAVKGRPDSKPFPLMVSNLQQLESLVEMDAMTRHLVTTFMPGAITFIFRKKQGVFPFVGETLGIRMADDPFVWEVIEKVGAPIWLPSANLSGEPTGTSSTMVLDQLGGKIAGVVEGEIKGGVSSSVFDITKLPEVKELRQGPIALEIVLKSLKDAFDSLD